MDTEHLYTFYSHSGIETLDISLIIPMSAEYPIQLLIGSVDGIFCGLEIMPVISSVILEELIGVEVGDTVRLENGVEVLWCTADDGVERY
jgi:hypothetical protein